jgi:metal-sulfur cluster biosynthetic enzyme
VPAELQLPDADETPPARGSRTSADWRRCEMTVALSRSASDEARAALGTVLDPELDEPITDLGFVRSLDVARTAAWRRTCACRRPSAPNFAYLMASDAKDVLVALPWTGRVVVELDDHHDST